MSHDNWLSLEPIMPIQANLRDVRRLCLIRAIILNNQAKQTRSGNLAARSADL
jgi:hypothetical protein